jgi:Methyltransferase domain
MLTYTIEELIKARPSLHRHGDGTKANWGLSESALRFIFDHSKLGAKTIEVGAGLSTVAFVLGGAEHYAIFPEPYLNETVPEYLKTQGISTKRLHLLNGNSQDLLPNLEETGFDVALIDGEHAFPIPFLDWYYIAKRLKKGGHLIIDDTNIWTGQVLRNFLLLEPEWRLVQEFHGTTIFRMESPWVEKWWAKQAYTVFHSQMTPEAIPYLPEQVRRSIAPVYDTDE